MRACYICDRNKERDEDEVIPLCLRCAKVHVLPKPAKKKNTFDLELDFPQPEPTPKFNFPYDYTTLPDE